MTETTTTGDALVLVQQWLHRALGQLDQAGEHIAAAHLLAAIDALDDSLDRSRPASADAGAGVDAAPERPLVVITKALVDRYGDQAELVARNQLAVASGDALLTWACIVKRIPSEIGGGSD